MWVLGHCFGKWWFRDSAPKEKEREKIFQLKLKNGSAGFSGLFQSEERQHAGKEIITRVIMGDFWLGSKMVRIWHCHIWTQTHQFMAWSRVKTSVWSAGSFRSIKTLCHFYLAVNLYPHTAFWVIERLIYSPEAKKHLYSKSWKSGLHFKRNSPNQKV